MMNLISTVTMKTQTQTYRHSEPDARKVKNLVSMKTQG